MRHLGTRKLETERLVLRRFTLEDAGAMYRNWASDPEVTKFLTWPTHSSVDVTKMVLADWVADYEKEDTYQWCIARKENDEPIGNIAVVSSNPKAEAFEIGYCISRKCWHQGITSEALKAVMHFLLEEVGAKRIESRHDTKNPHSGNVMKKCGLKYEGTRIQADWNNTGICDCALYGYVKDVTEPELTEEAKTDTATSVQIVKHESTDRRRYRISDETIEYVEILSKLELNDEEKESAKKDMGEMLNYIDKLNELDTEGVEPMTHLFPMNNVFREDVVTNADGSEATMVNAPEQKDGGFKVPKTIS